MITRLENSYTDAYDRQASPLTVATHLWEWTITSSFAAGGLRMALNAGLLFVFGTVVFLAAVVQGVTGLGFALVSVAVMALVIGPKAAVVLIAAATVCMAVQQIVRFRHSRSALPRIAPVVIGALGGAIIGTLLLVTLSAPILSLALGGMTLWYVLTSWRGSLRLAASREAVAAPLIGVASGVSTGSLGASGPILAAYLSAIGLQPREFMFSIACVFLALAMSRIVALAGVGQYTLQTIGVSIVLCVPAIVGQRIGHRLHSHLSPVMFRRTTLVVLTGAGASLIWRGAQVFRP